MKKPCDGYLLVEPIYDETDIIIPESVERSFNRGRVLMKGNDITDINVGDTIHVGKHHNIGKFSKKMEEGYLTPYSKILGTT